MTTHPATTPGQLFREALRAEQPLQIIGTVHAYCALMAEQVGFRALYVSGGAVAAMSYGVPDLGVTSLDNVLIDVRRMTDATSLPVLVDIDTGWGSELNVARTIQQMIKAGAGAVHIEDQTAQKRCGHRPGKTLVDCDEMVARLKAAVAAKTDGDFFIIARTDAIAVEGFDAAVDRAQAYVDAGADGIFLEAATELAQYETFCKKIKVPVLANMTEFGKTPLFTLDELRATGVAMVLYPWAATRAMNKAALQVYQTVREKGTQKELLDSMQDRETLYETLRYYTYEKQLEKK